MALLGTIGKRALNERFLIDECLSGALVAIAKAQGYQRVGRNSLRVGTKRRPMTGSAYCAILTS
jgi:hypothetical protein